MKKQTKVLAVLSTAMFMATVSPAFLPNASTAYAKSAGWTEVDGGWSYLDSYGDPVTDTWKKNGTDWYYLDSEGMLAFNMQVDEYYVGEDGKRASYKWVSVENEDYWSEDNAPEFLYYYYGKDGRALKSIWGSIDGNWYYFDEDGVMQTGSIQVDGYNYYLGADGVRQTGWVLLEEETENPENLESWYYFDKNGRRVENVVDKKIDGAYYTFVDGRMQTGWYKLPENVIAGETEEATPSEAASAEDAAAETVSVENAEPSVTGYQYYDEDGKRASGWRDIEGVENVSEDGEIFRFYFKNGAPYFASQGLELFTIDSKKYAFNTRGEMQTGKQVVNTGDGSVANFYFDEEGVMKTGKQTISDDETGEVQNWYFHTEGSKKGQGYHGIKDNTLYIYGLRQEADVDLRYAPVELDGVRYLVNTNGAVQKATSSSKSASKPELGAGYKDFTDENDTIWTVNAQGIIQ